MKFLWRLPGIGLLDELKAGSRACLQMPSLRIKNTHWSLTAGMFPAYPVAARISISSAHDEDWMNERINQKRRFIFNLKSEFLKKLEKSTKNILSVNS